MAINKIICFMDFDGVVHSWHDKRANTNLFCHFSRISDILDRYIHVDIVISSSWRFEKSWEEIMNYIPKNYHDRILGHTPPDKLHGGECLYGRYREISRWLDSENYPTNNRWIAIDDADDFPPEIKDAHVCLTDCWKGFMPENESRLIELIERYAK